MLDRLLAVASDGGGSLPPHAPLDVHRRACVAVVIRLPPTWQAGPAASSLNECKDVAAFRQWYAAQLVEEQEQEPDDAEVLFIRRAHNPRDRWSGQIGFPGGRSAPGEDDRACVEREFREELGVELGGLGGRFHCLGRLDDRLVRTRTPFAVAAFVFLQMDAEPTQFQLAAAEVAEAFWCPVSVLCGPRSRLDCLSLTMEELAVPSSSAAVRFARLLGVRALFFPCIYLRGDSHRPSHALWGLTLGIVSDLMRVLGLPSVAERRAVELKDAHPGLSRHAQVPFLTDSRLMNALLPAYFSSPSFVARGWWRWVGAAMGAAVVSMMVRAALASSSSSPQRRARL